MRHLASFLAVVAVVAVLAPTRARAQMNFTFASLGGRTGNTSDLNTYLTNQPLNGSECSSATLTLNVTGIPAEPTGTSYTLSLWRTTDVTEDCSGTDDRRLASTTTTTTPCVEAEFSVDATPTTQTVDIPLATLFDSCDTSSGTTVFCLLAMANSQDVTSAALATKCFRASLDVTAPGAATLGSTAGGESTANVSVTSLGSADDIYGYRLCTGGACGGDAGATSDPSSCGDVVSATSPSTIPVTVTDLTIGGDGKAVAIILVDRAGNESPLSNVSCVTRVNVDGFWDAYCRDRGLTLEACRAQYSGCSCAAIGAGRGAGPALLLVAGLALALAVRRRA